MDYREILEPYLKEISFYDGYQTYEEQLSSLPKHIQMLHAADWATYEINNGGIFQLLQNSTGMVIPEAIQAFQELGMPGCAGVLRDAIAKFGENYPREEQARYAAGDECWDAEYLLALTDAFFRTSTRKTADSRLRPTVMQRAMPELARDSGFPIAPRCLSGQWRSPGSGRSRAEAAAQEAKQPSDGACADHAGQSPGSLRSPARRGTGLALGLR